jgi:hypothetical protein
LHLQHLQSCDELERNCIRIVEDVPLLEFTHAGFPGVRDALVAWRDGLEDFRLHPSGRKKDLGTLDRASLELWFWRTMWP